MPEDKSFANIRCLALSQLRTDHFGSGSIVISRGEQEITTKDTRWASGQSVTDLAAVSRKITRPFIQTRRVGLASSPRSLFPTSMENIFLTLHPAGAHNTAKPDLELNIVAKPEGCFIASIPDDATKRGGTGAYTCTVPFQVGKRALGSLDLISELPKQGLPQYCTNASIKTGPYPGSVDPDRGEGLAQVFTAEFSIGNNGVGIAQARLHFQASAASRTDRCVVRYDRGTNSLYLLSDQAGKYLGPIAADGNDSLWNSRCLLSGCSHAEVSGDMLKVHFAVRFNPAQFAGSHGLFLEMVDTEKHASPAPYYGSWTVPAGVPGGAVSAWPADRSCPVAVPSVVYLSRH